MSDCPICLEALKFNNRKIHVTECNHEFHDMCLKKVKTNTCPCCRAVISDISEIISEIRSDLNKIKIEFDNEKNECTICLTTSKKILALLQTQLNVETTNAKNVLLIEPLETIQDAIEVQKTKINKFHEKINKQFIAVFLGESALLRLEQHYRSMILEKTTLLDEAIRRK
jgi:hypothetical protein